MYNRDYLFQKTLRGWMVTTDRRTAVALYHKDGTIYEGWTGSTFSRTIPYEQHRQSLNQFLAVYRLKAIGNYRPEKGEYLEV